ncbi:MAG: class I SAM-dependent methyltransferase [Pseudomonadota bacterium]
MNRPVEEDVRAFYDQEGWVVSDGQIGEDRHFRFDDRDRGAYAAVVEDRAAALLGQGETLLIAGSGDLPISHMRAAEGFATITCLDISERAIAIAEKKLGDRVEGIVGSVLDRPVAEGSFDAALFAHVIYHIDVAQQAAAIRALLASVRPGGRVVVLTANARAPAMLIQRFLKFLGLNRVLGLHKLYMEPQSLSWWKQFEDAAVVEITAHEVLSRNQTRALLPVRALRPFVFSLAGRFETWTPGLARRLWSYVAVTLVKRPSDGYEAT